MAFQVIDKQKEGKGLEWIEIIQRILFRVTREKNRTAKVKLTNTKSKF